MRRNPRAQPGVSPMSREEIARSRVTLPEHVVYREFPAETVMLNLKTELYFGLNPTAGTMLVSLIQSGDVAEAVTAMAAHFGRPADEIERDVQGLCDQLLERGLLERAA